MEDFTTILHCTECALLMGAVDREVGCPRCGADLEAFERWDPPREGVLAGDVKKAVHQQAQEAMVHDAVRAACRGFYQEVVRPLRSGVDVDDYIVRHHIRQVMVLAGISGWAAALGFEFSAFALVGEEIDDALEALAHELNREGFDAEIMARDPEEGDTPQAVARLRRRLDGGTTGTPTEAVEAVRQGHFLTDLDEDDFERVLEALRETEDVEFTSGLHDDHGWWIGPKPIEKAAEEGQLDRIEHILADQASETPEVLLALLKGNLGLPVDSEENLCYSVVRVLLERGKVLVGLPEQATRQIAGALRSADVDFAAGEFTHDGVTLHWIAPAGLDAEGLLRARLER